MEPLGAANFILLSWQAVSASLQEPTRVSVFHKMNTNPSETGVEERQKLVHSFPCVLAALLVLFMGSSA